LTIVKLTSIYVQVCEPCRFYLKKDVVVLVTHYLFEELSILLQRVRFTTEHS